MRNELAEFYRLTPQFKNYSDDQIINYLKSRTGDTLKYCDSKIIISTPTLDGVPEYFLREFQVIDLQKRKAKLINYAKKH